ncbi:50S ribosomal protein L33 [Colletotrichum graminicola]|nr:50S ribosomal protein L33 [Colletotrichum graminicola]
MPVVATGVQKSTHPDRAFTDSSPSQISVSGPFPSDSFSPPQIYHNAKLPQPPRSCTSSFKLQPHQSRGAIPLQDGQERLTVVSTTAKSRVMIVRLLSMAATGYFYTFKRLRTASPMSMLKYDPIIRRKVLFLEQKKKGK